MNKKILIIFAIAIILLVLIYFLFIKGSSSSEIISNSKQLYTCAMHPEIISDKPGLCPICEMQLVQLNEITRNLLREKSCFIDIQ